MGKFLKFLLALLDRSPRTGGRFPLSPPSYPKIPKIPDYDRALAHVLGIEGGFSDDPADRGGATNFGITEAVARRSGYEGPMDALPIEVAKRIYLAKYWAHQRLPCERIAEWHYPAALELFDTAVNMGVGWAARFFQHALNAMNRNGTLYPDLKVDGWAGQTTLDCLEHLPSGLDKNVLVKMLDSQQGARYLAIMDKRPTQEKFARGWFDKRVGG